MSNNIALTASMRSNLLSLQNTQNLMNKTQDRLSTGYKVNSAMDNPSSYFTAQSLNSRANDLSSLLDSIGQAISTLEVADKGITTLQDFVEQAKSIANNARDTSNVPASTSSKVKFNTETLRSDLVTDQVNGLTPGSSTMTIRLGEATKLSGDKNVSNETELSALSINTADVGTISVGGDKYNIDAGGTTSQMVTDLSKYDAGATFKVVSYDNSDATHHKITLEDADGNIFRDIDTGATDLSANAKVKVNTGKSVMLAQTITSDGKTVGTIAGGVATDLVNSTSDVNASGTAINKSFSYSATTKFHVSMDSASATEVVLTDKGGNSFNVKVADLGIAASNIYNSGNIKAIQLSNNVTFIENADGTLSFSSNTDFGVESTATNVAVNFATAAAKANTIYVDGSGTVEDMAKTLENMIGTDRISVSVENSNLQMKSLDTSSLEVKGTIADKFGLDKGTSITLDASDTAESLRQKISNMKFDDGRTVTAEFDTDGHLVVKSTEGDDMVISGDLAEKLGVNGAVSNGSNERAIYSKQFDSVLTQIDELVQDTSYKGINLLKGDNLTVNFNESRTSTIELKGVNFDATGLGFTQSANEWRGNADIDKALEQVTKATSMLRAQASEFGQNLSTVQIREDFTKNMINNLQAGADKLTLADMNEEAANMLSLQTRQQLGVNSLSLASQASQSVLKLF